MRVFVFGAGASRHAGYPLMNGLWAGISAWIKAFASPKSGLLELEQQVSETFPPEVLSNFETLLEAIRVEIAQATYKQALLLRETSLVEALVHYFGNIRTGPRPAYSRFAKLGATSGDVVITFNYDTSVETELWAHGKWDVSDGYGFRVLPPGPRASQVVVLKLHGSVNWVGDFFQGRTGFGQFATDNIHGPRPGIPRDELNLLGHGDAVDTEFSGHGAFIRGMILPRVSKQYSLRTSFGTEWEGFWNSIWGQAETALRLADEIFVVGYSLPSADERSRKLLLANASKQARITIASLGDTVRVEKLFREAGFTDTCALTQLNFEDWTEQFSAERDRRGMSGGALSIESR